MHLPLSNLNDRQIRLLLAGISRHVLQRDDQLRTPETAALEALETFADTGKSKTAVKNARRNLSYGVHALYVLEACLADESPNIVVENVLRMLRYRWVGADDEALHSFDRLLEDVCAPESSEAFDCDWRTPAISEAAQQMYQSRDFSEMPRLADLLESAGCADTQVIEHCRNPNGQHVRGCWVVDAVLDGSWAISPPRRRKPRTLMSQLPKRTQFVLEELVRTRDYDTLSLHDLLSTLWAESNRVIQSNAWIGDGMPAALQANPDWADEQLQFAHTVRQIHRSGRKIFWHAIARRYLLEQPCELAQGLAFVSRLSWLQIPQQDTTNHYGFLSAAIGEQDVAANVYGHPRCDCLDLNKSENRWGRVGFQAETAIASRDLGSLRAVVEEMEEMKLDSMLESRLVVYRGIIGADPRLVAEGLALLMKNFRRDRYLPDEEKGLSLTVHILYGWCRWLSPSLVAQFETSLPLPWDSGFHAWVERHDNPLAELDLNDISPILHEAIVKLRPPDWWLDQHDHS